MIGETARECSHEEVESIQIVLLLGTYNAKLVEDFAFMRKDSFGPVVERESLGQSSLLRLLLLGLDALLSCYLTYFGLVVCFESVQVTQVEEAYGCNSTNRVTGVNALGEQILFLKELAENQLDLVVVAFKNLSELLSS